MSLTTAERKRAAFLLRNPGMNHAAYLERCNYAAKLAREDGHKALIAELKEEIAYQESQATGRMANVDLLERCRTALTAAPVQQEGRYREVIEWALGERDTFPDWPDTVEIKGNPKFWWRKELQRRYDAALAEDKQP